MSTLSEADLRTHIRGKLEAGALPFRAANQKLYGGRGGGQLCDCCGRAVCTHDVLYEVESPGRALLAMHLRCFDAWDRIACALQAARNAG
jgi:hypothetical protein